MHPASDGESDKVEVEQTATSKLDAVSRQHLLRRLIICIAVVVMLFAIVAATAVIWHFPGYVVLAAAVAALIGPLGWFVTISKDDLYKLGVSKGAVRATVSVASVFALVASGVIVTGFWNRSEIVVPPIVTSTSSSTSPTISTPATTPLTTTMPATGALTRDGHCNPPNPSDWKMPDYELCVIAWCRGIVIFPNGSIDESRIQVKVRPRITNNTGSPLDVTVWKKSALRLLVRSSDLPDSWRPPASTAELGDTPYTVTSSDGQNYWAVAPNIPGDVDLPDDMTKPSEIGFATFWSVSAIPHDSAYPPLAQEIDANGRLDQDGDLVFQLPATTASNSADFVALVLVDRANPTKILATAWFSDWGPQRDPNSF